MRFLSAVAIGLAALAVSSTTAFSQTINPVVFPCGLSSVEPSPPHKPEFTSCDDSRTADMKARCLERLKKVQDRYQEKLQEHQAAMAQYKEKQAAYEKCTAQNKADSEAKRQAANQQAAENQAKREAFKRQASPAMQAVADKFSARGQLEVQENYRSFWLVLTKSDDMRADLQTVCRILASHDYAQKYRQYNPSGQKVRAVINIGSLFGPRQEMNCE